MNKEVIDKEAVLRILDKYDYRCLTIEMVCTITNEIKGLICELPSKSIDWSDEE